MCTLQWTHCHHLAWPVHHSGNSRKKNWDVYRDKNIFLLEHHLACFFSFATDNSIMLPGDSVNICKNPDWHVVKYDHISCYFFLTFGKWISLNTNNENDVYMILFCWTLFSWIDSQSCLNWNIIFHTLAYEPSCNSSVWTYSVGFSFYAGITDKPWTFSISLPKFDKMELDYLWMDFVSPRHIKKSHHRPNWMTHNV